MGSNWKNEFLTQLAIEHVCGGVPTRLFFELQKEEGASGAEALEEARIYAEGCGVKNQAVTEDQFLAERYDIVQVDETQCVVLYRPQHVSSLVLGTLPLVKVGTDDAVFDIRDSDAFLKIVVIARRWGREVPQHLYFHLASYLPNDGDTPEMAMLCEKAVETFKAESANVGRFNGSSTSDYHLHIRRPNILLPVFRGLYPLVSALDDGSYWRGIYFT